MASKNGSKSGGSSGKAPTPRQAPPPTHPKQPQRPPMPYIGNGRPYDAAKNPNGTGKPKE